jgi:hypothetical protein
VFSFSLEWFDSAMVFLVGDASILLKLNIVPLLLLGWNWSKTIVSHCIFLNGVVLIW